MIDMKTQQLLTFAFISLISATATSAEYEFRKPIEPLKFARNDNGGTKPVEPEKPTEPEYDITPYQNMAVTGTAGNEREYEFNPSYSVAKSNDIIAKQSNILLIQIYDNSISAPLKIIDSELEKNIKGIEIITSDNVKHVCNNPGVSGIENTNIWCNNFTPALNQRMEGPYSTATYTISFTK